MSASESTDDAASVTAVVENEMTLNAEEESGLSTLGGEVLAQAIEDLSVQEKGIIDIPSKSEILSCSFSNNTNLLPPINTFMGHTFNTRTTSPVAESVSPTFGVGGGQTNSSPSTSQVSVGSVGPTLVASLLNQRHHYDLTPVMRNTTSSDVRPVEKRGPYPHSQTVPSSLRNHTGHSVVSPETVENDKTDFLHGEHLSLPADLCNAEEKPILPNLRKTAITTLPMQRAKSLGKVPHPSQPDFVGTSLPNFSEKPPPAPVDFPSRKFYSFTSREQYKGLQKDDDDDLSEEESLGGRPDLTPYQPSRQEFSEIEETLPPEELESIFIARQRRSSIRENRVVIEGMVGEEDEESSHKNHRLLQNPIPMTDRQWSIPSLRMAHRLATDGSLASLTDHPDEEESLLYVHPGCHGEDEDEASLSSRASSLYMSVGGTAGTPAAIPLSILEPRAEPLRTNDHPIWNDGNSSSFSQLPSVGSSSLEGIPSFGSTPVESTNKIIVDSPWNVLSGTHSSLSDENSAIAVDGDRALRRKRKQRQREEAALSWLQSLQEQSQPAVAEAASSKFLTGRTQTAFRKSGDDASAFATIKEEAQRQS